LDLDDEFIDDRSTFFETKIAEALKQTVKLPASFEANTIIGRLVQAGLKAETLKTLCLEEVEAIEKEPGEVELLCSAIHHETPEQKAQRDYLQ